MKFDSTKKIAASVLFNLVSALAVPLVVLADRLAKTAGGKGPVAVVSDERVGVLLTFVRTCLNRAADLKTPGTFAQDADGSMFEEKANQAWRHVVQLQERASEAGMSVNLLEIFGRVEASTVLNDMRRLLRSEQTRYDADVAEIADASQNARGEIAYRLAQATARLSVMAIDLEEQKVMSDNIEARAEKREVDFPCEDQPVSRTPEEIDRRVNEVIMEESCRQASITRIQAILTLPMDRVRDRLQTFYEKHPERRGTLRFTEASKSASSASSLPGGLSVGHTLIEPATVNVAASVVAS